MFHILCLGIWVVQQLLYETRKGARLGTGHLHGKCVYLYMHVTCLMYPDKACSSKCMTRYDVKLIVTARESTCEIEECRCMYSRDFASSVTNVYSVLSIIVPLWHRQGTVVWETTTARISVVLWQLGTYQFQSLSLYIHSDNNLNPPSVTLFISVVYYTCTC